MLDLIAFFRTAYEIEVTTADKKEGGTIHNGWLILEGSKSTSQVFVLNNSAQNKILRRSAPSLVSPQAHQCHDSLC